MYDVTASKGLAAFILMHESREHEQHGSSGLCKKDLDKRSRKQVELMEDRDEGQTGGGGAGQGCRLPLGSFE